MEEFNFNIVYLLFFSTKTSATIDKDFSCNFLYAMFVEA